MNMRVKSNYCNYFNHKTSPTSNIYGSKKHSCLNCICAITYEKFEKYRLLFFKKNAKIYAS